jgi:hypothetical protein
MEVVYFVAEAAAPTGHHGNESNYHHTYKYTEHKYTFVMASSCTIQQPARYLPTCDLCAPDLIIIIQSRQGHDRAIQ